MATADKDGRIAQMLSDRLACLGMEMHESLRDAEATVESLLPPQTAATPDQGRGTPGVAAPHADPDALSPRPGRLAAGGLGAPSAASRVRFVLACLGLYVGVPAAWVAFLVWLVVGR